MFRSGASVGFESVTDEIRYEEALAAADMAVWLWRVETDHFQLCPTFFEKTSIPEDAIDGIDSFLQYVDVSQRAGLLQQFSGQASAEPFKIACNFNTPAGFRKCTLLGKVTSNTPQSRALAGTLRFHHFDNVQQRFSGFNEESQFLFDSVITSGGHLVWSYQLYPPIDIHSDPAQQVIDILQHAYLEECNHNFSKQFGVTDPESLYGSAMVNHSPGKIEDRIKEFVNNNYQLLNFETYVFNINGEKEFWEITARGSIENNQLVRIWGTSKNVTASKRYVEKLEYQATHDSLTQLPNRFKLYQEIQNTLLQRPNQLMALLILDVDRFKEINDTLGHHAGDNVLRLLGPRLEAEMEDLPGLVVRLGGDEFGIFLSKIRNPQQAVVLAHRLLDAVQQPFDIEGFHSEIGASIGVAIYPEQANDVSTMMRYADVAMYRAKKDMQGVALYQPDLDPHSPKRLALMGELGKAIREDQLVLHFQPKLRLGADEVMGVEALLRWTHPELGFITPGEFIPIAENTGLIHPMTLWVLEKSICQGRRWLDVGKPLTVSVNLSTRNLLDENITETILSLLIKYEFPAHLLELEITESAIMEDPKRALQALNAIHELGVKLAIDDFGTGYSSLSYLKKLPVQVLKIDFSFVINMLEDEQDRIIVNSTINLAHNLGLEVVAEGVETAEARDALLAMGCDMAQGYYFAKPMPVEATNIYLSSFRC